MTRSELPEFLQRMDPEPFPIHSNGNYYKWAPPQDILDTGSRCGLGDRFSIQILKPGDTSKLFSCDYFTLVYAYSGELRVVFPDTSIVLCQGQTMLIAPDTRHGFTSHAGQSIDILLTLTQPLIQKTLASFLAELPAIHRFCHGQGTDMSIPWLLIDSSRNIQARGYLEEMCCEHFDPDWRTYTLIQPLLQLFLTQLDRCAGALTAARKNGSINIDAITRYIRTNVNRATLQSTAARFGFSPNYFSHLLKETTGMGFMEHKHNFCMYQSARMLENTDLSIVQIAQEVGIRNITQFYRLFHQYYGVTPAQYRRDHKDEQAGEDKTMSDYESDQRQE